jgi:GNAT superfamily N-acetyltransferase
MSVSMTTPMPTILPATPDHVDAMVALSEAKRTLYAAYQPTFWRKAPDSAAVQTPYFHTLLARASIVAFVAQAGAQQGAPIVGFVIASIVPAPAVYDPGGLTCMIDDFCVAEPAQWATVGRALLTAATAAARARGATQTVVVAGAQDAPKRAALIAAGLTVASEWYTGTIAAAPQL